jgi:hypothetical protein
MRIWRLFPVDPSDPNWQASAHRGVAIVRAETEEEARELAQHAFGVKTRFSPGSGIIAPPWKRAEHVTAEIIADSPYDREGPPEVLQPSFVHDLEAQPRK